MNDDDHEDGAPAWGIRRVLRLGIRTGLVVVGGLSLYLIITFLQVWAASTGDAHDPADAIVVLGAAQYDGTPSPVLQRRLDHAIELYESDIAGLIDVTGGKQTGVRCTEAAASYT